ncbi:MAG: hypothetical protein WCD70_15100 [Alphaproteobacteria bacterium]
MFKIPENFLEGINDDGIISGTGSMIETHYGELESLKLRNGYLAVIIDWQDIEIETRIPLEMLDKILAKHKQP